MLAEIAYCLFLACCRMLTESHYVVITSSSSYSSSSTVMWSDNRSFDVETVL